MWLITLLTAFLALAAGLVVGMTIIIVWMCADTPGDEENYFDADYIEWEAGRDEHD